MVDDGTHCPRCSGIDVTWKRLVERSYVNPVMAAILATMTAGFIAISFVSMLMTFAVGVGILMLLLWVPVTRQIIGVSYACRTCGHRWAALARATQPSLRTVR